MQRGYFGMYLLLMSYVIDVLYVFFLFKKNYDEFLSQDECNFFSLSCTRMFVKFSGFLLKLLISILMHD